MLKQCATWQVQKGLRDMSSKRAHAAPFTTGQNQRLHSLTPPKPLYPGSDSLPIALVDDMMTTCCAPQPRQVRNDGKPNG